MIYKKVEISEQELEDLIRQNPGQIEEGLIYLSHQRHTEKGRLDMLFVDSGNALVIAELKIVEDDGMLWQGLDYYEDLSRNLETLARLYNNYKINPEEEIRLILIAPSFSLTLINRCKWMNIKISLFTYNSIELYDTKEKLLTYNEVTIPSQPVQKVEVYKEEDHINYIIDTEVRKLAINILKEVRSLDKLKVNIDPVKYSLSLKYSGKVFAYLDPKRQYFWISTYNNEKKWTPFKISGKEDANHVLELMKNNIEWFKTQYHI